MGLPHSIEGKANHRAAQAAGVGGGRVDDSLVEAMLGQVNEAGSQLTGEGGFVPALIKARVWRRVLGRN